MMKGRITMAFVTDALFQDTVAMRRFLHAHPEVGFDLENTAAFVRKRLSEYGVPYTERYGRCSVCALIGDVSGDKPIIALRADMDALPIQEASGVPYASENPGRMHACGHDSHTAVLLTVARLLKENESSLSCGVKLIFQPSEEGEVSGARMMVENGVMDDVSFILGMHCENTVPTGTVGIRDGAYMAACAPINIAFIGRSVHAAMPATGVDAIAMAVRAYGEMKRAVAEEAGGVPYIWSVGCFNGGTAHNIVAGCCELKITFRYYDQAFADRAEKRVRAVCEAVAGEAGGAAEIDWRVSAPAVINDSAVTARFRRAAGACGLPLTELPARMSSEDFSWYLTRRPGAIFRFGTRNEALGCATIAHRADFRIDENGMKAAIEAIMAFVMGA